MGQRAVAIDVSIDEFVVMVELADRPVPPWVDASAVTGEPEAVRAALRGSAIRSLQARRMVGEGGELAGPIASLVGIITHPELVVTEASPGVLAQQAIAASAEVGVHHTRLGDHLHRLTAFPTEDLSMWLGRMVAVEGRPPDEAEGFDVPATLLRHPPRPADAERAVLAAGVPPSVRAELVSALDGAGVRLAEALWLEAEGRVRGAQVAWLPRPSGGAWLVPAEVMVDDAPERLALVPCDRGAITSELMACLPTDEGDGHTEDGA